jgi:hypothetical protein
MENEWPLFQAQVEQIMPEELISQLMKEIREPNKNGDEPGNDIDEIEQMVLNQVDMTEEMLKRVQ